MKTVMYLLCVLMFSVTSLLSAGERFDPAKQKVLAEGTEDFTFAVLGDNRPWGSAEDKFKQNEHFMAVIKWVNAYKPDLAVLCGDMVLGYSEKAILLKMWDAFDKAAAKLAMPYILVVGNHDVWSRESEDVWLERYGPIYFSWEHKGCRFIALDSDEVGHMGEIGTKQLAWFAKELRYARKHGARRIFVFLHKPLWAYDFSEKEQADKWASEVHPLLIEYGVDTVFAGHEHLYRLYPLEDGVKYVVTGGAGAELNRGPGGFFHFLNVEVKGSSSSFKLVTSAGEELAENIATSKVTAALGRAVRIEPLEGLGKKGQAVIKVKITNPLESEVKVNIVLAGKGTSWKSVKQEVVIAAGSKEQLVELKTRVKGSILPLPQGQAQLQVGETKLMSWNFYPDISAIAEKLPVRLLDNFEDRDTNNLCGASGISGANGAWEVACDDYGVSKISPISIGDFQHVRRRPENSLHLSGTAGVSKAPKWVWAYLSTSLSGNGGAVDISDSIGIAFRAYSMQESKIYVSVNGTVGGKDLASTGASHRAELSLGDSWQTYRLYWQQFKQPSWACPGENCVEDLTLESIKGFNWAILDEGKQFDLWLDDVELVYEKQ